MNGQTETHWIPVYLLTRTDKFPAPLKIFIGLEILQLVLPEQENWVARPILLADFPYFMKKVL
jgi:hypothetical protein